jgi:hypothetical protein
VLFARVGSWHAGTATLAVPEFASLDARVLVLALVSGVLLLRLHWSVHRVLAVAVALGMLLAR